jgi:hypothetical protein
MSIFWLAIRRICDGKHATGTKIPYSAHTETGTQLPIIAQADVKEQEEHPT